MRLLPLFALTCALSSAALAQPNIAPPAPIKPDLLSLFTALNDQTVSAPTDYFRVPGFISGARIGFFGLSEWKDFFVTERGKTQFRLNQVQVEKLEGNTARVKVTYSLLTPNNVAPVAGQPAQLEIQTANQEETLDLKREIVPWDKSEKWRIVPPSFETLQNSSPLSLSNIAYYGSQREGTLTQLRARISTSRLAQTGLGALQFVQDYDEQLALQNDFWRDALRPYVQNDSLFLIPGTQTPYTFNDHLSGKILNDMGIDDKGTGIKQRGQTVLFYEGENEKPIFRYNGQAAICFVDGHVKLVSPEAAKSLIWKP